MQQIRETDAHHRAWSSQLSEYLLIFLAFSGVVLMEGKEGKRLRSLCCFLSPSYGALEKPSCPFESSEELDIKPILHPFKFRLIKPRI